MTKLQNNDSMIHMYYHVNGNVELMPYTQKATASVIPCKVNLKALHGQSVTKLLDYQIELFNLVTILTLKRRKKFYALKDFQTTPQDLVDIRQDAFVSVVETILASDYVIDDKIIYILYKIVSKAYNHYQYERFTKGLNNQVDIDSLVNDLQVKEERKTLVQDLYDNALEYFDLLLVNQQFALFAIVDKLQNGEKLKSKDYDIITRIKKRIQKAKMKEVGE